MANDSTPQNYGSYNITAAQLLLIPELAPQAENGSSVRLVPPTLEHTTTLPDPVLAGGSLPQDLETLEDTYYPITKKMKVSTPPVLPPTPPVSAVGVMDVGQGNCNLLIGQPGAGGTADVFAYYDTGYPLWFYVSSLPPAMRFGGQQYAGPIPNNQANTLRVILSHWDWDHWRLGAIAPLNNLQWTFPNQPIGPAAANFLRTLANANVINAGGPPFGGPGNSTIFSCVPTVNPVPVAMLMNNTGLALSVPIVLPTAEPAIRRVVLTGDANFNSVPLDFGTTLNMTGITAVHHGSNAHGAAQNLRAPAVNIAGRIAYSYGITTNGNHAYGFPVALAVTAYQNAGWTAASSTAQGQNINQAGLAAQANRGNVQMGRNVVLLAAYNNTAFATFPNQLN
ncbi:MAG TPA: hypothetical protein VEK57_17600 [Thermoanaerobaculia bacterium]|nr:hypothetical protein [Thermoanaerobaculia bacterium]